MTGNLKDKAFNITLSLFFTCTVLYYFFRFQFDLNFYTVVTQATLMILLSLVGLIRLLSISNLNLSYQKFAYCAAVLYCALLLLLTFFRGGMPGLLYGLKDFFLPILLIFAYKSITTKDTIVFFYKLIGFIGFIVSCIYLLEYLSKFVLFQDYFKYTEGIRNLSLSKGIQGFSQTAIESGIGTFYRMPGPLSHTNTTGLLIAISILSLLPVHKKSFFIRIAIVTCIAGLLLTGARTAIIGFILGYIFFRGKSISLYSIIALFLTLIFLYQLNLPYLELLNLERFFNTILDILQKIELLGYENLINIFIGFGFNYPNMNLNEAHSFFPILEDDLFILQLVTMYGAIPLFLFIRYLFFVKPRVSFNLYNDKYWLSAKAIIICALITAFHTNAIIRPQIFPIFFFYIVMADQIVNFYRVQDNRK